MMRRAWLGLLLLAPLTLGGCEVAYVLRQGAGQASLMLQREDLAAARVDPRLSESQRARLELASAAKRFAVQLGLKQTSSYEHVVVLDRSAVTYVVAAAAADSLSPYLWHFPVVGAVPYKGYFDRKDAEAEEARLQAAGYDTYLRGVAAFSLLGMLPDPLYSSMLAYPPAALANIVIHELTHATVFLPGAASFNEGFATFVGNEGARRFLAAHYGPTAPEVAAAAEDQRNERAFADFVGRLAAELRELYAQPWTPEEKLRRRAAVFARARAALEALGLTGTRKTPLTLNNAYVMTQVTYRSNLERFGQVLERCHGDLPAMIRLFRDEVAKDPDPAAFVDRWLATGR